MITEAARRRRVDQHNELVWVAWHVAALQQMKKLPKFASLRQPYPNAKRQTPDQMHLAARMIANTFKNPSNG